MKCLTIDDKWFRLIFEGKKTWEIRRTTTNFRGRIALGNTKSKKFEGYANITDCREFSVKDLKKFGNKNQANGSLRSMLEIGRHCLRGYFRMF